MISHNYKVIFIHIPKTGGTSIEKLFGVAPFNPLEPDYEHLVGWCPVRKFYMQHATPQQLLETNLISPEIFEEYFKFTIIRNTYSKLVSDYFWHRGQISEKGSFFNYLMNMRPFKQRNCNSKKTPFDYSSHVKSQIDFINKDGKNIIDEVFEFEKINEVLPYLSHRFNLELTQNLHEKKGNYNEYYQHYYSFITRTIAYFQYRKEITYFKFKF